MIAYLSGLAITRLSHNQEEQQSLLLATRVADTVEHHIKRERIRRERRKLRPGRTEERVESQSATVPDWAEVREQIIETIVRNHQELIRVRVFSQSDSVPWHESIRWPADASLATPDGVARASEPIADSAVVSTNLQGNWRLIEAKAPVIASLDGPGPTQIATVDALLSFDESISSASELRRLLWSLMLLAIISITLVTYFLFRNIVYNPIDELLCAMSKAEGGNLAVEVERAADDEIGLLTARFNRMLARIRQMTDELNQDQRRLEDRVRGATAEIAERSDQLEEANLRLFELQRQMTQLERLAASGQLAAQFAHEVGTPLNLISGHVQLLRARATDERIIKRLDIIAGQKTEVRSRKRNIAGRQSSYHRGFASSILASGF